MDGLRAREIAEALAADVTEELGHAQNWRTGSSNLAPARPVR